MSYGEGVIAEILQNLGIEITDVKGSELQAHCPAHEKRTGKADANPSWYINADTGRHICFSCGFKGSVEYLLISVKGYDDDEAKRYLDNVDMQFDGSALLDKLDAMLNREVFRPTRKIPESRLALFTEPPTWALKARGVTLVACNLYGVRWDQRREAWILPLRDRRDGKLIGWQEKGQVERTFRNVPPMMRKSTTLFGVHVVQGATKVVVVESPLDALKVYDATGMAAVAICGARVSYQQLLLLRGFVQVIVAVDNPKLDKAGRQAAHEMLKAGDRLGLPLYFFAYGDTEAKDPGDMTRKQINDGVTNARSSIHGRGAVSA